jgi:LPXTG-motif cell wall-anchored protein
VRKSIYLTIAVLMLAFGAAAPALAQDTGVDEYIEGEPTAGGEEPTETGSGTSDGSTGTVPTTPGVTSSSGTEAATGTGTATASGSTAELPRTGSDTTYLALIGLALLAGGLLIRRGVGTSARGSGSA